MHIDHLARPERAGRLVDGGGRSLKYLDLPRMHQNFLMLFLIFWVQKSSIQNNSQYIIVIHVSEHRNCMELYFPTSHQITGWWYTYPSEKYEFVSWDDAIPNIWKVIKFHGSKPRNQMLDASPRRKRGTRETPFSALRYV